MAAKPANPRKIAFQHATCAAILAATFTAPLAADSTTAVQGATCATILAGGIASLKASTIDAIRQYCHSSWRQAGMPDYEWDDCTQDVIVELLNRLPRHEIDLTIEDPGSTQRRELMRSVWCVTQRYRRAFAKQPISLDVVGEQVSQRFDSAECLDCDLEKLDRAIEDLNPAQQTILHQLRQGDSVAEIAEQMELPAARVSDQKYKAVRKLQKALAG